MASKRDVELNKRLDSMDDNDLEGFYRFLTNPKKVSAFPPAAITLIRVQVINKLYERNIRIPKVKSMPPPTLTQSGLSTINCEVCCTTHDIRTISISSKDFIDSNGSSVMTRNIRHCPNSIHCIAEAQARLEKWHNEQALPF